MPQPLPTYGRTTSAALAASQPVPDPRNRSYLRGSCSRPRSFSSRIIPATRPPEGAVTALVAKGSPESVLADASFIAIAMAPYTASRELKAIVRTVEARLPRPGDSAGRISPGRTTPVSLEQSSRPITAAWLSLSASSSLRTAEGMAAPSRMEQSAEVGGGPSQLVKSDPRSMSTAHTPAIRRVGSGRRAGGRRFRRVLL
jgi:hypothetical protein